jgi:hypothetical protein
MEDYHGEPFTVTSLAVDRLQLTHADTVSSRALLDRIRQQYNNKTLPYVPRNHDTGGTEDTAETHRTQMEIERGRGIPRERPNPNGRPDPE